MCQTIFSVFVRCVRYFIYYIVCCFLANVFFFFYGYKARLVCGGWHEMSLQMLLMGWYGSQTGCWLPSLYDIRDV